MILTDTKIYLDIDGSLIHEDLDHYNQPAAHLEEFLEALVDYDVYWLTTHCRNGDPIPAQQQMQRNMPQELLHYILRYKPTVWDVKKTDAIDFGGPFLWLDDTYMDAELEDLKKHNALSSLVKMDLRKNPNQLGEIIKQYFV